MSFSADEVEADIDEAIKELRTWRYLLYAIC
jgi:hypothetical protein